MKPKTYSDHRSLVLPPGTLWVSHANYKGDDNTKNPGIFTFITRGLDGTVVSGYKGYNNIQKSGIFSLTTRHLEAANDICSLSSPYHGLSDLPIAGGLYKALWLAGSVAGRFYSWQAL